MDLRARVSERDELQRQQQALLAWKDKELAGRPASRAGFWPWLAAAFAVLMPIAWWLGGRRGKACHSSGGHHDPAGMSAAGDRDEVDGKEHMQKTEPESSVPVSPAWHPTMRQTAPVAAAARWKQEIAKWGQSTMDIGITETEHPTLPLAGYHLLTLHKEPTSHTKK